MRRPTITKPPRRYKQVTKKVASGSSDTADDIVRFVQKELKKKADPGKAVEMAAYMKTQMPFYGVQKPDREPIVKILKQNHKPQSLAEYEDVVLSLWNLPYREEKYISLNYADAFIKIATPKTVKLFERLVREGAWWDFVDVIASHLIGHIYQKNRDELNPIMDRWIKDDDFWIRRTAILSQLRHKKETDGERLFDYCLRCVDEKEFFIRKAIGWALREYSYTDPQAVKKFLLANKDRLSTLSFREGSRVMVKKGLMKV